MPAPNYRQMKRRREDAQKKEQLEKQARRGRVPADRAPDGSMPPGQARP
ncbi:MAG: hypothetical protein O9284_17525 [Steroidobacteraceae bacterium]|jgi:hypothetical protein|nr:hypothetical protein [Steroidobacteraceae bacterium]